MLGLSAAAELSRSPEISGLPPYRNTKKSTKPLLHGASQKKLTSRHWVHFPLKMAVPLTVSGVERFRRVGCIVIANLIVTDGVINL